MRNIYKRLLLITTLIASMLVFACSTQNSKGLQRIQHNNPGLEVDLGVGLWAWPLPMDYDQDGDYDLVVSCPDKPYNGIYFFENIDGNVKMPVFKPAVRLGPELRNIQPSYGDGQPHLLIPGHELLDYRENGFEKTVRIYPHDNIHESKVRANQWKYCDYDGDKDLDLVVGIGDWTDYGWDNAFNNKGRWTRGPLHGYVYLIRNNGSTDKPEYAETEKVLANGKPVDVYGMPSPNFADFDGDDDLDLLCGEFIDKFTYFENIGTRKEPKYDAGRYLTYDGQPITMDLQMIIPVAFDWDKDGDIDLIAGQEDGRVAFIENNGTVANGMPQFLPPKFFRQQAAEVKFGALVTPYSFDWDGDGDEDLICGNTAGYIGFIENLDGGNPPKWAEPKYLKADGNVIRIQAGYNMSIQGPCEAKWGYTTLSVADWNHDDLPDIIVNSILGEILWYQNIGSRQEPQLAAAKPVQVEWTGRAPKPEWNWWEPEENQLVTQWRTTPAVIDLNHDGLNDLVMLDHQGYLTYLKRESKNKALVLLPGERIFKAVGTSAFDSKHRPQNEEGGLLHLNTGKAGSSGRRKLCFADWDLDGRIDLLVNSKSINFLRNISEDNHSFVFQDMGIVDDRVLAGHTTSPTVVDWDKNGVPDLLVGAEDGYLYYLKNPHAQKSEH